MMRRVIVSLLVMMAGVWATTAYAQDDDNTLLSPMDLGVGSYTMEGFRYEAQGWNNCGPATLTMGLSYFGYEQNQVPAANWLKPGYEDKNVSPWEMVAYVNTQVGDGTRALYRHGGDFERIKALLNEDFPVIIEAGYDPAGYDWMGHYLLVKGYDDTAQQFITNDSFYGENYAYSYDEIRDKWAHFNNLYIVLYDASRESELMSLLGDDADERVNIQNALAMAQEAARADASDAYAWFNIGTSYTLMGEYEYAAAAYDEARKWGLPWRMLWYQFGPFEAYNAVGRYQDTLDLARQNLNDGGGQYVEETFYYAGVAREALGETQRALDNYGQALSLNANYTAAREARDALSGS